MNQKFGDTLDTDMKLYAQEQEHGMTMHDHFDTQLQAVEADDSYGPDFVVVEGEWTNTKTGRIGPAALALDPADVTFGDDSKGYVLGSVLRTAVAEIAAEEGFTRSDKDIVIRIDGCLHSFNTAGEIIAPRAGDTPEATQMRTNNTMIDNKTTGHPYPMLTVFAPAGSKLPHVGVYSNLDGAIAAFSLENALDERAEVALAIFDDPSEGLLWFSLLAGHSHPYGVDTTLSAARDWKSWWQREHNVVIDDTGTIVSQS